MSKDRQGHKVEDGDDQRNLIGGLNTSGSGMNHLMVAFNTEMTEHGTRVDGGGSDW